MKPRITLSVGKDGEFELWINPEGRDLLVRELLALNAEHDHFHLFPPAWWEHAEVPISLKAYRASDQVLTTGKVLFRPDEWDREYFPHVLDESG
ncbi:MAG: hypothetical protein ACKVP7_26700 [Hyphomicrobiaceae bacterium]